MIVKDATQVGNKLIRNRSKEVANPKTKSVQKIVTDLTDSMRYHGLVGMAAPQIGKGVRVFVTEIKELRKSDSKDNIDPLKIFINPQIISSSKAQKFGWEGCGSVAFSNLFGMVKRPVSVIVQAIDQNGNNFELKAQNLLARVVQHEIDHLNGIVFADKADTCTYMSKNEYEKLRGKKVKK